MMSRAFEFALVAATLLVGCGGGGSDLKLLPVKGTLTQGGKALSGIKVVLETSDVKIKAPLLYGIVQDDGTFEIQTSAGEMGAPAGLYQVVLVPPAAKFDYAKPTKGGPQINTDLIPKNYQSATTTELSYEVKSSAPPLEIKVP